MPHQIPNEITPLNNNQRPNIYHPQQKTKKKSTYVQVASTPLGKPCNDEWIFIHPSARKKLRFFWFHFKSHVGNC